MPLGFPGEGEAGRRVIVQLEVLGHLVLAEHGADGSRCRPRRAGRWRPRATAAAIRGEVPLGGGQEVLALAGAFAREVRVAADDEPLAGKVGRGDLGEVALVEQRELQCAALVEPPGSRARARR